MLSSWKLREKLQKPWILTKTADFDENHRFWWKLQFSGRFKFRNCKNHISNSTFNRITLNTEIHRFLSEMKDHLPKKVTPIFVLCTQLTPFKTIWSNFIIVYPIESFQDHLTWFLYCVPKLVLSRSFDLILSLCTQLTPFKTIWPDFCIVYPFDFFQDHLTQFIMINYIKWSWKMSNRYTIQKSGHMVLKGVNWLHIIKLDQMVLKGVNRINNDKIGSNGLERSQLVTQS